MRERLGFLMAASTERDTDMDATSFLTNSNVLTVVGAYLDALDATDFDKQVALIQSVIRDSGLKKIDISRLTNIPVTRLYEYNRKDWVDRHRRTSMPAVGCNVMLRDMVRLLTLANNLSR
jgi:hypothetical protein